MHMSWWKRVNIYISLRCDLPPDILWPMDFFIHFMTCQYFPETLYSRRETWTVSFYLRKPWIKKGMQKTESALPICYTHMWIVLEREFLQTVNPLNNNSTNKKRFNNIRFCFMEHYNISALTRRGNVLMSTNSIMVNAAFVVKSNLHGRSIIPLSQYRT